MKKFYLLFVCFSFVLGLQAQDITITTQRIENHPELALKFRKCEEYHVDIASIQAALKLINKPVIQVELELAGRKHTMEFVEYNLIKPTAKLKTSLDASIPLQEINPSIKTYRGNVLELNGGIATLTIADNYMIIAYQIGSDMYYLEPSIIGSRLNHEGNFTYYKSSDVIIAGGLVCGSEQVDKMKKDNV